MSSTNKHTTFNFSDIQRYVKGEMSALEMYEIEKAALDDPFLAEAIEGYSKQYQHADASEDLAGLQERLHNRTEKRGVVTMKRNYWWSAAAVLILMAGSGAVVYTILNSSGGEKANLARKEALPSAGSANESAVTEMSRDSVMYPSDSIEPPPVALRQSGLAPIAKEKSSDKVQQAVPEKVEDVLVQQPVASQAPVIMKQQEIAAARNRSFAETANQKPLQEFRGKVIDTENKPIEGASVTLNNNQDKVLSDKEGNFTVKAPDTAVMVEVNSEGYVRESVTLRSNAPSTPIRLEESLSGKVAGVTTKAESDRKKAAITSAAEPLNGLKKFEEYIETNRKIPVTNSGEVLLSFSITRNGRPVNIKIEKSLSKPADAEAIRLLKEGPPWKYIRSRKEKATIAIKF